MFCVTEPTEHLSEENKRFLTWTRNIPGDKGLVLIIGEECVCHILRKEVFQE